MEANCPITGFEFMQRPGDYVVFKDERGRAHHAISGTALRYLEDEPDYAIDRLECRLIEATEEMSGNCIPMIRTGIEQRYEIEPRPWGL